MADTMTTGELAKRLGVENSQVSKWRRSGMPARKNKKGRYEFKSGAVKTWLVDNGLAIDENAANPIEQDVARTRHECAEALDVSTRTVSTWLKDTTFPGYPGSTGQRNGYFPISKITAWRAIQEQLRQASNQHTGPAGDPLTTEWRQLKIAREKQKLGQETGVLVDIEVVANEMARTCAIAKQGLSHLPAALVAILPADLDARVKADYERRATAIVQNACQTIADMISSDD